MNNAAAEKTNIDEIIKIIDQEMEFYKLSFKDTNIVHKINDQNLLAYWIANRLRQEGMLK